MPSFDWEIPHSAAPGNALAQSAVSTSRTIMLPELRDLLAAVPADAGTSVYESAIVEENVLAKPTRQSRARTYTFLRQRYGLNPHLPLFRAMRDLWDQDNEAQPLITILAALARDPVLRASADAVLSLTPGSLTNWELIAASINAEFPGRFTPKTSKSTAQNAAASWTQSGHLHGTVKKTRRRVEPRPTAVAYALLLGHLCGVRGDTLFTSPWARVLDASPHVLRELAVSVSRQGWIDYRHAGAVTEVSFRYLLREETAGR